MTYRCYLAKLRSAANFMGKKPKNNCFFFFSWIKTKLFKAREEWKVVIIQVIFTELEAWKLFDYASGAGNLN